MYLKSTGCILEIGKWRVPRDDTRQASGVCGFSRGCCAFRTVVTAMTLYCLMHVCTRTVPQCTVLQYNHHLTHVQQRSSCGFFTITPEALGKTTSEIVTIRLPLIELSRILYYSSFTAYHSLIAKVTLLETFVGRVAMSVISVAFAVFSKREECI